MLADGTGRPHRQLHGCVAAAVLVASLAMADDSGRITPAHPTPKFIAELESWLTQNAQPPATYITNLFTTHDAAFLGEWRRIRHDPELVRSLLAPLYAAGVTTLATETAWREDQVLIDSLLVVHEWREDLARTVTVREPTWKRWTSEQLPSRLLLFASGAAAI